MVGSWLVMSESWQFEGPLPGSVDSSRSPTRLLDQNVHWQTWIINNAILLRHLVRLGCIFPSRHPNLNLASSFAAASLGRNGPFSNALEQFQRVEKSGKGLSVDWTEKEE